MDPYFDAIVIQEFAMMQVTEHTVHLVDDKYTRILIGLSDVTTKNAFITEIVKLGTLRALSDNLTNKLRNVEPEAYLVPVMLSSYVRNINSFELIPLAKQHMFNVHTCYEHKRLRVKLETDHGPLLDIEFKASTEKMEYISTALHLAFAKRRKELE